jgi:sialic acid synthase SpsE
MIQPAEALLTNILKVAKVQLEAAKAMDHEKLTQATEQRQDLVFELELERGHVIESEEINILREKLERVDKRLMDVLKVISNVCQVVSPPKTPTVYGANGRIKDK